MIERIGHLEKRVQQQDDELICLKSTLADVLRRLQQTENTLQQLQQANSNKLSPKQSNVTANKQNPVKPIIRTNQDRNNSTSSNGSNPLIASRTYEPKLSSSASKTNISEKVPQNGGAIASTRRQTLQDLGAANQQNSKDLVVYNCEAGMMKLYIHGRPVQLNIPSHCTITDFDSKVKAPKEQLKLEWVYGYRGKDCRSNICQLPTGEIVYFVAATIILYNVEERQQRHYTQHTDDVKCMAINPDHVTIASGQTAGHGNDAKPHVRIWDSVNLTTIATIGLSGSKENFFQNSICCLAFSKFDSGQQLCIIDDGAEKVTTNSLFRYLTVTIHQKFSRF